MLEKPESLKFILKDGRIPLDATLVETVEELLDWYFNQQPYGGAVARDHGKPRQQVYNENLHTKRVASAEDLNLMLMRSSRAQKVTRPGRTPGHRGPAHRLLERRSGVQLPGPTGLLPL